ncbi:hypothetical protein BI295_07865 [Mycobacterium avium subsp. hominissuis]|nr:hypothetical protein BI295_07865 [Mycobacterium avium subsp. hominissuis]
MFDGCVGRAFASTKGCLMAGLKRFVFALILVLTAVLMGGCSAACGQPSWLLRVAGVASSRVVYESGLIRMPGVS